MAKKIRLIDDESPAAAESEAVGAIQIQGVDGEQLMKYVEAIDWKLWEILKLARKQMGED